MISGTRVVGFSMPDHQTRILWTSNIVLPAVAGELGLRKTPFGGWLSLMTEQLAARPKFRIGVAMRAEVSGFRHISAGGIEYFALPQRRRFDVAQADCDRALELFRPDILHVEGAEMRHSRRFLDTWQGVRLLSMQGVINGYSPYDLGRLPILAMLFPHRPRLMLTAMALISNRRLFFLPRLKHERSAMRRADHIVGRTLWDQAQAAALAPKARYHHCARILRDPFYTGAWAGTDSERHTIFVGNGASPRKGAHVAIQALSLLHRDFPDARLYIAGQDPTGLAISSPKRHVGYPVYLRHLIRKWNLQDHVVFTGVLDAGEMASRMATSHVCLMSSIIENSPNTLGEAMLLGVPVVSSYAGGAPSMARDEEEALFYRADDPAMLAHQVRRIFRDDKLAARLSVSARARARITHDPDRNLDDLVAVYDAIMDEQVAT